MGFFDSEEGAAKCYDAAVLELRGPAASTNFEPTQADAGANPLRASVLQHIAADPVAKYVPSSSYSVDNSRWCFRVGIVLGIKTKLDISCG